MKDGELDDHLVWGGHSGDGGPAGHDPGGDPMKRLIVHIGYPKTATTTL